jgi:hypothetical protein
LALIGGAVFSSLLGDFGSNGCATPLNHANSKYKQMPTSKMTTDHNNNVGPIGLA